MSRKIDSLQDMCIFYCVNHLDTLATLLENFKHASDEASASFSTLLGNKITENYFIYQIGEYCSKSDVQPYVDKMLETPQFCNSLTVNRRAMLTADTVSQLANKAIKVLEFTFFDDYADIKKEFEELVKNNLKNLTKLKIKQKSTECDIEELLQLLSGGQGSESQLWKQDQNTNNYKEKQLSNKSLPYLSKLGKSNKKDKGIISGCLCSNSDLSAATPGMSNVATSDNSYTYLMPSDEYSDSDIDSLSPTSSGESHQYSKSDRYIPNLVSFHYNMCYSSLQNLTNSYAVFDRLCCIIERNTQLQSITIVSVMPNPCKWFLLNTDMVTKLENLHSLVLSQSTKKHMDIELGNVLFSQLPQLQKLRHLDLSYGFEHIHSKTSSLMKYSDDEVDMFREALKQMPKLKSIDISGSNLCKIIRHVDRDDDSVCTTHCMPGFEGRMFDYIGLFNCEQCTHKYIPAVKVSGNSNEKQILVAVWTYHHNQLIMSHVLRELKRIVFEEDSPITQGIPFIEGLLLYLEELGDWDPTYTEGHHLELRNIHYTVYNLYYLLELPDVKENINIKTKRVLVERVMVLTSNILNGLDQTSMVGSADPHEVLKIFMLIFRIIHAESVVVYSYRFESYMMLMIKVLHNKSRHNVKMLALGCIFKAAGVSQEYKKVAGFKLEFVKFLLNMVRSSLAEYPSDEIEERDNSIWSVLWRLTDAAPENCKQFVEHSGCTIAQDLLKTKNAELVRRVTGVLSNVSEEITLHPYLMEPNLVNIMRKILTRVDGGSYQTSSHAAAYLVMLAHRGPEFWALQNPSHAEILTDVDNVIKQWNINSKKDSLFRSLMPMLNQISNRNCVVAQHWGAWVICNLVILIPEKYCDLLISEGGLDIIGTAIIQPELREDIKQIMQRIIDLTKSFKMETFDDLGDSNDQS